MRLAVHIQMGLDARTVQAGPVRRVRAMGEAVRWELRLPGVRPNSASPTGLQAVVAERCLRGDVDVRVQVDGADLSETLRFTGFEERGSELWLLADETQPDDGMHTPRWRVHQATDSVALVQAIGVASMTDEVADRLGCDLRDDGEAAVLLQAGISDREFLRTLLYELHVQRGIERMVVSGGLGLDDDSGLHVRSARGKGSRLSGAGPTKPDHLWKVRSAAAPSGEAWERQRPVPRLELRGGYDGPAWATASQTALPWKQGTDWVHRVEDVLEDRGLDVGWDQSRHVLPDGASLPGLEAGPRLACTNAWGVVTENDELGPHLVVELPGLEGSASCHLLTPSSGPGGNRGLNLVPHVDTHVLVTFPNRLDASATCLGNFRLEPAQLASPSLDVDRTLNLKLGEVDVPEVGKVRVHSDLEVDLDQAWRQTVAGTTLLALKDEATVDGTDLAFDLGGGWKVQAGEDIDLKSQGDVAVNAAGDMQQGANGNTRILGGQRILKLADGKADVA